MISVVGGLHYPRSTGEFGAWFGIDADCLDHLEWLRWPEGLVWPDCGHRVGWRMADGRLRCAGCDGRTSVTAGTIFDKTRTPLTVWFNAAWLLATQKDGVSAQSLQRALEIGKRMGHQRRPHAGITKSRRQCNGPRRRWSTHRRAP